MTPNTDTGTGTGTGDSITVEPAHLRGLIATGTSHALMWDGQDLFIAPATMADNSPLLEITTHDDVTTALAHDNRHDLPDTLDLIARNATENARLRLADLRQIRQATSASGPYTTALRPYGINRDQLGHLDPATRDITIRYRTPDGATATLAMPYFRDSISPMTITVTPATTDAPGTGTGTRTKGKAKTKAAPAYTATVPRQTPPAAVAALIATATGLTPGTALRYTTPDATGFPDADDARMRLTIAPAYARALAAHGPGWAIMWNNAHAHPVIARPERGDDGHLLEICLYERMFNLSPCDTCDDARTCEACLSGQPDFAAIAADMTDILGDHHLSIDNIAAYMPITLHHTRALRAIGYERHFQGHYYDRDNARTVRHDAYGQYYRSPDGHLIEVIIPIHPGPAPLIIRWTYLGRTAPGDTYPTTNMPADTPPASVAALITAHIAIHPPTPAAPDTTDGTGGPDSAATPAAV
jgi:hypothetical protein